MYPYFAFEMPNVRNKIAHQGFWDASDLKNFANELMFDIYAIINSISLTDTIPFTLHRIFPFLRKKISDSHYDQKHFQTILAELFAASGFNLKKNWYTVFFDAIKNRESYKEVLEFYKINCMDGVITDYYQECCEINNVFHTETFWGEIINLLKSSYENPGLIGFVNTLANNYIGEFEKGSRLKDKTIQIKQILKSKES